MRSEGWLAQHPEKEEITRRYLKFQPSLYRMALARLVQEEEPAEALLTGKVRVHP
jgi:RNA repair, ligase-Pnkp-associating, region of Hen1